MLSGTVRGLSGTGLVLQNNLGSTLPVAMDGPFFFPSAVPIGTMWTVTVQTQPQNHRPCTVSNGSGTIAGNVTSISVDCGLSFRVMTVDGVTPGVVGLATARAVLVGPSRSVQATADATGSFSVAFPQTERPYRLTVAAPGHEALSIIGLDAEAPTTLFIAPTSSNASTGSLMGSITGKANPTNLVSIDVIDGNTLQVRASSYASLYNLGASTEPLHVVALEVANNTAINWVASPQLARTSAGPTFNVVFPSPAAPFRTVSFTVAPAPSGLLASLSNYRVDGALIHYLGDTTSVITGAFAYVVSGWLDVSTGLTVVGKGIDGPFAPNQLHLALDGPSYFLRLWRPNPMAMPSTSIIAPVVTQLTSSGANLWNVSATSAGVGFDTLELQVAGATNGPSFGQTYWRIYTAPDAAQTITSMPPLPMGVSVANLGTGVTVSAMPVLIRFADRTTRPWQLPTGNASYPAYEVTVAGIARDVPSN